MTSPADTAQLESLTSAETIVAFGAAPRVRDIARGMSVSAPAASEVTIDRTGNVEFTGDGEDSRNCAMGQGLDSKGIGGLEPKEQIIGLAEVGLPADFVVGTYAYFLSLPDPVPALANRPEYAIRLANTNLWDATTGFNNLSAGLVVSSTPDAAACAAGDIPVTLGN